MTRRGKVVVWVGGALLLFAAGAFALAAYLVRPAALRADLTAALQSAGLQIERLDEISMGFGGRVRIRGLRVAQPAWAADGNQSVPALLEARDVDVDLSISELLRGKVRIQSLRMNEPEVAIVVTPHDAIDAATQPRTQSWLEYLPKLDSRALHLPAIQLRSADVQLLVASGKDVTPVRRWVVDGECSQQPVQGDKAGGLTLRLSQVGGSRASGGAEPALFRAELREKRLGLTCGDVDLHLLKSITPPRYRRYFEHLSGGGNVLLKNAVFRDGLLMQIELAVRNISGSVPIEEQKSAEAAKPHFLQYRINQGQLGLNRRAGDDCNGFSVELHGGGTLNDAETRFDVFIQDLRRTLSGADIPQDAIRLAGDWLARGVELNVGIDGFVIPAPEEQPAFFASNLLPEPLRAFLADYRPAGPANLRLAWKSWERGITGSFEPVGMRCRYFRFPYAFENVHGKVVFTNAGILLEGLQGEHGLARVRGDGRLQNSHKWTGFELAFVAENLPFDRDLYQALPPEYQLLWRNADPLGISDAHVSITRLDASTLPEPYLPNIRIDARMRAGSVVVRDGERLRNADASILIEDRKLTVRDMGGFWRGSPIRVRGVVEPPDERGYPRQQLRVEGMQVAIERSGAIFDERGAELGQIRFSGSANLWGQIGARNGATHEQYVAQIVDGNIFGFDNREPWSAARGWVNVGENEQEIIELQATRGRGQITVRGKLPMSFPSTGPVTLDLTADDVEIERLLSALIPGKWNSIREALGLSGAGRVQARFHPSSDGKKQIIDIDLLADRMKPGPLPIPLTEIAARLTLDPDGLLIHECRALYQSRDPIRLSGRVGWDARDGWARLAVEAPSIELTGEFVDALPLTLGDLLRRMTARGRVALAFDPLELVSVQRQEWQMSGTLRIQDGALRLGIPLEKIAGQLTGTCKIDASGSVVLGSELTIDSAILDGRPVKHCVGRITSGTTDGRLHIDDVKGLTCGGSMMGFTTIDSRSGEYDLSLTVTDVALGEFLKDDPGDREKPRPGRLDGRIFLRGRGDDPGTRQGGGEFRIRGASLLSSPITRPLAEQGRKRPQTADVERADLRFAWEADLMRFNRIELASKDLRLIGTGTWGLRDDRISMTLAGAAGEDAPRLAILSDLWDSASQELMQYRIEGTIDRPRVTVEPLHNLTDPLRRLLKGE